MKDTYRAVLIGCSRMGAFIDHEVVDMKYILYPYSHAAVYTVCDRTDLVACSDLRPEVMAEVGRQYGVPPEKQYVDYREMIEAERPDIVSIATQPEGRAEIAVHAAEHGARAIYAEKAMTASMAEADAIVEACERNGVVFNLGTQRRWHPGFHAMRGVIDSGELGELRSVILQSNPLFNGSSHYFDNLLFLNGDRRACWAQMQLLDGDWTMEGDRLTGDPTAHRRDRVRERGRGIHDPVGARLWSSRRAARTERCASRTIRSSPCAAGSTSASSAVRSLRERSSARSATPRGMLGSNRLLFASKSVRAVVSSLARASSPRPDEDDERNERDR